MLLASSSGWLQDVFLSCPGQKEAATSENLRVASISHEGSRHLQDCANTLCPLLLSCPVQVSKKRVCMGSTLSCAKLRRTVSLASWRILCKRAVLFSRSFRARAKSPVDCSSRRRTFPPSRRKGEAKLSLASARTAPQLKASRRDAACALASGE